jgi:hypothetical protein
MIFSPSWSHHHHRYTGLHEEKVRVMGERDEARDATARLTAERETATREKSAVSGHVAFVLAAGTKPRLSLLMEEMI